MDVLIPAISCGTGILPVINSGQLACSFCQGGAFLKPTPQENIGYLSLELRYEIWVIALGEGLVMLGMVFSVVDGHSVSQSSGS